MTNITRLIRSDDSSDLPRSGSRWLRRLFVSVDDIEILESRSGVEQHDRIIGVEESRLAKFTVGSQGCCALRCGENCLDSSPVLQSINDFIIGHGQGHSTALLQDIEDEVVAVGFRHAKACCYSRSVWPELRVVAAFVPGFRNGSAARRLYNDHLWALWSDPAEFLHFVEGLPHADQTDSTPGGIDDALRHAPTQLFGHLVAHGLL